MRTPLLHRLAGDDALAARAGAGDDLAFAALVRRVQPRLHGYCAGILGNAQDADDAVQNTFIKALAGLRRGEDVLAVRPWLYRIAHNEAISLLRRRRAASELVATVPDRAHGPAEAVAVREEMRAVLHAIGELPERARDAFLLREVGGLRHAEVAEVLGTSPGNARQAVFEARVALQDDRAGRDASCHAIRAEISGRERRRASRAVRGHLRSCSSCRAWSDAQAERRRVLGLAPGAGVPLAGGLWGWLGGLLGGGAAGGGATVKIVASVAAIATIAPVGVSTLERRADDHDRPAIASPAHAARAGTVTRHRLSESARAPTPEHAAPVTASPAPAAVPVRVTGNTRTAGHRVAANRHEVVGMAAPRARRDRVKAPRSTAPQRASAPRAAAPTGPAATRSRGKGERHGRQRPRTSPVRDNADANARSDREARGTTGKRGSGSVWPRRKPARSATPQLRATTAPESAPLMTDTQPTEPRATTVPAPAPTVTATQPVAPPPAGEPDPAD